MESRRRWSKGHSAAAFGASIIALGVAGGKIGEHVRTPAALVADDPSQPRDFQQLIEEFQYKAVAHDPVQQEFEVTTSNGKIRLFNLTKNPIDENRFKNSVDFFNNLSGIGVPTDIPVTTVNGFNGYVPINVLQKPETNHYVLIVPETAPLFDRAPNGDLIHIPSSIFADTLYYANQDATFSTIRQKTQSVSPSSFISAYNNSALYTEVCQAIVSAQPLGKYAKDPDLVRMTQEAVCNTFGDALGMAAAGYSYAEYSATMSRNNIISIAGIGSTSLQTVDEPSYNAFVRVAERP